ncbi:DUF1289 domain-containing protein [Psychromonas aquatilis]|uniref:DUF1289 domain-containing protein n=1 Tax=Psychromonas aquatilis TaxID=2005072 RepID=A0ABU9GQD4_9GAMM
MIKAISPCIKKCTLDKQNVCMGCFRSLDEIMEWSTSTEIEKENIVANALQRKETIVFREKG